MNFFEMLQARVREADYLHVLLNPLPIYGLAMGTLALGLGLFSKSRGAQVVALVLIFLSAASAWPVYYFGEAGYDRIESKADRVGVEWLDEHKARGEKLIASFYVLAAAALAGLLVPLRWPRSSVPLVLITLAMAFATLVIGAWIAYPAGRIRHTEFRFESPPARDADQRR